MVFRNKLIFTGTAQSWQHTVIFRCYVAVVTSYGNTASASWFVVISYGNVASCVDAPTDTETDSSVIQKPFCITAYQEKRYRNLQKLPYFLTYNLHLSSQNQLVKMGANMHCI